MIQGQTAHDNPVYGYPLRIGARGVNTNYTTAQTGDAVDLIATLVGALVVRPYSIPEQDWTFTVAAPVTATADTVLQAAAGAGIKNYLAGLQIINTNAVATEVVIKDGATVIWRSYLPANMSMPFDVDFVTHPRTSANAALNFACITTGANVYVSAQGYKAP
jgi:hypothetical protein